MANRVIAKDVKEIIETDLSNSIVETFIKAANLTVSDLLGSSTDLSDAQKKEIERWFTAHLIASTRERQASKEKADEAEVTYTGKTGMNLDSTFYGQQVKILDTTGIFAAAVGKKTISLEAVTSFE